MPSQTIKQFEDFISYIESLGELDESYWLQPIAPGKWSLKELVCHLWNWDRYSMDVMIPMMENGAALPDFVDIEQHNLAARELAKTFNSSDELIEAFAETRRVMIQLITDRYDKDARFTIGTEKRKYSIDTYLQIFTHHDLEHKKQIDDLITKYT